jgi:hypothetical protein
LAEQKTVAERGLNVRSTGRKQTSQCKTETTRAAFAALVVESVRDILLRRPTRPIQLPSRQFVERLGPGRVREDRLGDPVQRLFAGYHRYADDAAKSTTMTDR